MTIQKKILDLTGSQYLVQKVKSAINDVDSSLSTHIADTDIHVTTADKNKWNNQTYVFRYSSAALTPSSTNANSLLDNTDNLKVGDKVIDSSGVIFSITAIDTQNSTFTIGTALIDLAQDSDVVHKSGAETVGGVKTFSDLQIVGYGTQYKGNRNAYILPEFGAGYSGLSITTLGFSQTLKIGNFVLNANNKPSLDKSKAYIQIATGENNGVNACTLEARNSTSSSLGTSANKWSKIYGTEYYYGSNNVEFSDKFVTTDTNQTISGAKNFAVDVGILNTDTTANTPNLNLRNYKADRGTTDTAVQSISFLDKNAKALTVIESRRTSNGSSGTNILTYNTDDSNNTVSGGVSIIKSKTNTNFAPNADNTVTCGRALAKWSDVQTYKINNVEPSSLSLPDLSNAIDISSYITDLAGSPNAYIPPANGYIALRSTTANVLGIVENTTGMGSYSRGSNQTLVVNLPVVKNSSIAIYAICSSLTQAKFIPCQGNV